MDRRPSGVRTEADLTREVVTLVVSHPSGTITESEIVLDSVARPEGDGHPLTTIPIRGKREWLASLELAS